VRPATLLFGATVAALCVACAGPTPDESSVRTDVHCVDRHQVPITVGDQVHFVRGACKAWTVGPTPREQQRFAHEQQRRGGGAQ